MEIKRGFGGKDLEERCWCAVNLEHPILRGKGVNVSRGRDVALSVNSSQWENRFSIFTVRDIEGTMRLQQSSLESI